MALRYDPFYPRTVGQADVGPPPPAGSIVTPEGVTLVPTAGSPVSVTEVPWYKIHKNALMWGGAAAAALLLLTRGGRRRR